MRRWRALLYLQAGAPVAADQPSSNVVRPTVGLGVRGNLANLEKVLEIGGGKATTWVLASGTGRGS
jgi:hypothetical protein